MPTRHGDEPINPLLEEYSDDDTMLLFPPGRYRMNEQFRFTGFEHFAIVGEYDVTIVPDDFHNFDDGGDWTEDTPGDELWRGPTGIVCNTINKGTITFKDCSLGGFPDNGLYAANGDGQVIVDGGVYKNSQTASVRIGGKDSIVKNARIVIDDSSGRGNQHAIRAENSNYIRVIDCDIEVTDPNGDAIKTMDVDLFLLGGSTVRTAGDDVIHGLLLQERTTMARIKESTFVHEAAGGFSVWVDDGDSLVYQGRYVGNMTPVLNYGDNAWIESIYADRWTTTPRSTSTTASAASA